MYTQLAYHIVDLFLKSRRMNQVPILLRTLEDEMREYWRGRAGTYPVRYEQILTVPWVWAVRALYSRDRDLFWRLHTKWIWKRLKRISQPVIRNYKERELQYSLDIRQRLALKHYIGIYEYSLVDRLVDYLESDSIIFDIGANCGLFSIPFAQAVPNGKVFAFEPNPEMVELLRNQVIRNGFADRISIYPFALGREPAWARLTIRHLDAGKASLRQDGVSRSRTRKVEETVTVEVRTYDEFANAFGHPVPRLVKIDVEGYEPEVVETMTDLLARHHPILLIELSPAAYDAGSLIDRLRLIGYNDIQQIRDDGCLQSLPARFDAQINALCRKRI